jgi:hypothetical protein
MSDFVQGMFYVIIIFAIFIAILGAIGLAALHWFLTLTENRTLRLTILAMALLPGYFFVMKGDAFSTAVMSFLFIAPMAVLIPVYVFPGFSHLKSLFEQFLLTYVAVVFFSYFLMNGFLANSFFYDPEFFWYNPLSIARSYSKMILLDTILAFIIYWIWHVLCSSSKTENTETE